MSKVKKQKLFKNIDAYIEYLYKLTPEELDDLILVLRGEKMFSEHQSFKQECLKNMISLARQRRGDFNLGIFQTIEPIQQSALQMLFDI